MLKIHGRANSINVRKVLWMCGELDLAYQRTDWGRGFRATSEAEFRRVSDFGVVPVIGPRGNRQMTPEERRERDLYIYQNPTSNAAEASRSLRTNLLFMSTARKLETLLITSASP